MGQLLVRGDFEFNLVDVPHGKIILEGIVGSRAHGLDTLESDWDTAGVFVVPTDVVLGMHKYRETVARNDGKDKKIDPDKARHEVEKFLRLCLSANPSVLELLFLPEHLTLTEEGRMLVEARQAILSDRIRDSHIGYAVQQIGRIKNRWEQKGDASFSSDTRKRTEKHARHVFRLFLQGSKALDTGTIIVRLTPEDADSARAMGILAVTDLQKFLDATDKMIYVLENAPSALPDKPDYDTINDLLVTIRKMNLC